MRMSGDCHNLFAKMSEYYDKTIECIDVNGMHVFLVYAAINETHKNTKINK